METLGTFVIWVLVVALVFVAGKGLVGKADPSEDVGIDYDPDGLIMLDYRKNK